MEEMTLKNGHIPHVRLHTTTNNYRFHSFVCGFLVCVQQNSTPHKDSIHQQPESWFSKPEISGDQMPLNVSQSVVCWAPVFRHLASWSPVALLHVTLHVVRVQLSALLPPHSRISGRKYWGCLIFDQIHVSWSKVTMHKRTHFNCLLAVRVF